MPQVWDWLEQEAIRRSLYKRKGKLNLSRIFRIGFPHGHIRILGRFRRLLNGKGLRLGGSSEVV